MVQEEQIPFEVLTREEGYKLVKENKLQKTGKQLPILNGAFTFIFQNKLLLIPNHHDQNYPAFIFQSKFHFNDYIAKNRLPIPDECKNFWELEEDRLTNVEAASKYYIATLQEETGYVMDNPNVNLLTDLYNLLLTSEQKKKKNWKTLIIGYSFLFGKYLKSRLECKWSSKEQQKGYYSYYIPFLEWEGRQKDFISEIISCFAAVPPCTFEALKWNIYVYFKQHESLRKDFNFKR